MVFPVIFAALYVSHFSLLRLPYYWDEAGYYIPAAWDFFRTGSLIPITTMSNAHPPLPSVYLALWWKLSGFFPEVTREGRADGGFIRVARGLATGAARRWFRPGGLLDSRADGTLSSLVCAKHTGAGRYFRRSLHAVGTRLCIAGIPIADRWLAALWFTAAVLSKETAIAVPDDAGRVRGRGGDSGSATTKESPLEGCGMVRSMRAAA